MIGPLLARLLEPRGLGPATVREVFDRLVDPSSSDAERAALLVGLASRDPSASELALAAREMRRRSRAFVVPRGDRPIDLCGSGGAARPSFNVSTVSALVVASAGVPVVKHGNRSARGFCGSSDLLEALGLPVTTSTDLADATYRTERLAFLHAPLYHPATAAVREARRQVGIPTIFNRLGPLSNPARVPFQVVGAPDPATAALFAEVLPKLGVRRGVSMSSQDGTDEFSPRRPTTAFLWGPGSRRRTTFRPEGFLDAEDRRGDWDPLPPPEAARESEELLAGARGAKRGSVLLTSGVSLWVAGAASSVADGVRTARATLDSGAPKALLGRLRATATSLPRSGA